MANDNNSLNPIDAIISHFESRGIIGVRNYRLNNMIRRLKILFGCKGTWLWACRKMEKGHTIYRLRDSGVVYFTYNNGERKINATIWWETSIKGHEWGICMSDVYATDFKLHLIEGNNYPELHRQSQLKTKD